MILSGVISNGASNASKFTLALGSSGGSAIIKISNTNTYTSPTTIINSGRVLVSGSIGSSASLTMSGTAKLDVTGTIPANTINGTSNNLSSYDTTGTPSTSSVGSVNGNLVLNSTNNYNAWVGASNASSKMAVTGNITVAGTCTINNPTAGTFTIMTYTGTLSGTFSSITAAGHATPTATYTGGNVIVTVV